MNFKLWGVNITLSYPFLAVLTVFLALDKTGLAGQMLCAALLHEAGHLVVMYAMRQAPACIALLPFGIRIEKQRTTALSYGKEALIFLAGPLANFVAAMLLFLRGGRLTTLGQVHLLLGLFNLLPVGVLDGGQALRCLCNRFATPRVAQNISISLALLCLLALFAACAFLFFAGQANLTLIFTLLYLSITLFTRQDG